MPADGELDEGAALALEGAAVLEVCSDADDAGEVGGPFGGLEAAVCSGGDDVDAAEVDGIEPAFVDEGVLDAWRGAEGALENVVAEAGSLLDALADDSGTRFFEVAEDADGTDLRFGGFLVDDAGDGGAVAEDIDAAAGLDLEASASGDDGEVVF